MKQPNQTGRYSMNKTHSVVAKALACIAVFLSLSCTNPLSAGRDAAAAVATSEKGVLTVTIGDPGAGRAKTIVPAASDLPAIATYELTLTCTGQTTKSATFTTLTGSINYLVPGTWTVAVVGKTAGGITVASGSKDVAVTASASAEVTVNLAYITASATDLGSMSLTLTFPKTVGIDSVVASIDGAAVAPALEIMDNGDTDNKIVCAAKIGRAHV